MDNALIFTGLLILAALAGGYFGACCKNRKTEDLERRIADLEDRLGPDREDARNVITTQIADVEIRADELHDHVMDLRRTLKDQDERLKECELLIGDTPTGGLLGRVGALEDKARKEAQDER